MLSGWSLCPADLMMGQSLGAASGPGQKNDDNDDKVAHLGHAPGRLWAKLDLHY